MPTDSNSEPARMPGGRIKEGFSPEVFEEKPKQILFYVNILLRKRWLIIGGTFILMLFAGMFLKLQPPEFTATAKFLTTRTEDISARMSSIIGPGVAINSGYASEANSSPEFYTALLQSSLFLERIVRKTFAVKELGKNVDLLAYFKIEADSDSKRLQKGILALSQAVKISYEKSWPEPSPAPILTIIVVTGEPQLSADIVNAFLEELGVYNQSARNSKAVQNREFIEKQLKDTQDILNQAEAELATFSARNKKIVTPYLETQKERLMRTVRVQEELYITLKKQLELAKIEEQEKQPSIEVIEKGVPPLRKSGPAIRKNVMIAGFLGIFVLCGLVLGLDYIKKIDPNKENIRQMLDTFAEIKNDMFKIGRLVGLGKPKKKFP